MTRLWQRMSAIYGSRWSSNYGEAVDKDGQLTMSGRAWSQGLEDLTLEDIVRGLAHLAPGDLMAAAAVLDVPEEGEQVSRYRAGGS